MAKWKAWIVRKQYFKVEVDADDYETAQDLALSTEVNPDAPDDIDWDIYDLIEVSE